MLEIDNVEKDNECKRVRGAGGQRVGNGWEEWDSEREIRKLHLGRRGLPQFAKKLTSHGLESLERWLNKDMGDEQTREDRATH